MNFFKYICCRIKFYIMKGVKIHNFSHAKEKVLSHISKLETKESYSIVSISFHSSIID